MQKSGYKELALINFLKDRLIKSLDDYLFEEELTDEITKLSDMFADCYNRMDQVIN